MKLDEKTKANIDKYFNDISPEELVKISVIKYGFNINDKPKSIAGYFKKWIFIIINKIKKTLKVT